MSILSQTTASAFHPSNFVFTSVLDDEPGTFTDGLQADPEAEIAHPKIPPGAREFQCPYCFQVLPKAEIAKSKWRQAIHLTTYHIIFFLTETIDVTFVLIYSPFAAFSSSVKLPINFTTAAKIGKGTCGHTRLSGAAL